jgi:Uma2 family endonuclease
MGAARLLPEPADPSTMDHFLYLRVDWQGYQQLLALRGESSVPRITYLEGLVELMSPSRYHELDKTRFARLLETWSEIANVFYERGKLRFFALRREADDDVCREISRSEFLPQLPIDVLPACMNEPDQTSAARALRAALAAA